MYKSAHRSRSMRSLRGRGTTMGQDNAGTAHGPYSPILGAQGLVSGRPEKVQDSSSVSQNGSTSAFPSSSGDVAAKQYRQRPLPTPPRLNAPSTMAERPNTSAGPSSRKATEDLASFDNFDNFDKRMSKDDLYVRTSNTAKGGYKSYHIPIRGKPPTPDTPRSRSPDTTIPVRTDTPDSMEDSPGVAIGMALGSPTRVLPATYANWQPHFIPGSRLDDDTTTIKQKSGRWKLFSRRGGKNKESASKSSTPEPPIVLAAPTWAESTSSSPPNIALDRSNTSKKAPKFKPIIIRSQTEPAFDSPTMEPKEPKESKEPREPKETKEKTVARKASTRSIKKSDISAPVPIKATIPTVPIPNIPNIPPPPPAPFLDVEIPSIKMDRYSVMFSSVLNPQPASSLLARRQATLDKLKSVNDAIAKEEEAKKHLIVRRATSPQPTKSPSFSLFPMPPSRQHPVPPAPRLSPLSRSNTSPAALPSPSKAVFEREQPRKEPTQEQPKAAKPTRPPRPPMLVVPTITTTQVAVRTTPTRDSNASGQALPEVKPLQPQRQAPPVRRPLQTQQAPAPQPQAQVQPQAQPQVKPQPAAFNFGPDQSGLILDSPTDMETEGEVIIQLDEPPKQNIPEPAWQMVSPPASTPSSSTSSVRKRSPSSVSSVQTHVTKPSIDEPDNVLKTAVEISIARQISLSQQQRSMLQPLQTNLARSGRLEPSPASAANSASRSPVRRLPIGRNERLAETKSATPTLIHPKQTLDSQLAQHRKSSRIVVEKA